EQEEDLITVAGLKYIEVSTQEAYDTLACGNKKQKMKSINNHFHMPWHVETDMREVA
ncbi:MAG: hypothetical protein GW906_12030, partial [Epsilonproteobacteria bacterium]|nr:hypothetical protein [Campylobacterota bacterium]NCO27584.1 hypothetical protein [Campylobacterota bacterium]NCO31262.1 hypothetical protein [Campylobacterota bacterium]